jgi:hypothetical protein
MKQPSTARGDASIADYTSRVIPPEQIANGVWAAPAEPS